MRRKKAGKGGCEKGGTEGRAKRRPWVAMAIFADDGMSDDMSNQQTNRLID